MNVLLLDTSSETVALGIRVGGQVFSADATIGAQHSDYILPSLARLLRAADSDLRDLSGIILGVGPGGFTGLRMGVALGQALAFALNLPVLPVSSLLALAKNKAFPADILACFDARMGEIYAAAFQQGELILPPCVLRADDLPPLPAGDWYVLGSGARAYGDVLRARLQLPADKILGDATPTTASLLACLEGREDQFCPPEKLEIAYVREKVALKISERAKA